MKLSVNGRHNGQHRTGPELVVAGLSHHTAPLEVRDQVALAGAVLDAAREALRQTLGPVVVLSTCNRTEIYAWTTHPRPEMALAISLSALLECAGDDILPFLYAHRGAAAVRHLFRVVAGLDSLVNGEYEIQGQVRAAWQAARRAGPLGAVLERVFQQAMQVGRRVRTATNFGRHPSVAASAVRVVRRHHGTLTGRTVAVVGAGVAGKAAARALLIGGAEVLLLNRSPERAAAAAETLEHLGNIETKSLAALPQALRQADAVITSTAATRPILSAPMVAEALPTRQAAQLLLLDIGVPRDIDPAVRRLPGVIHIDFDDLERLYPEAAPQLAAESARAEALVADEVEAFAAWRKTRTAVPAIVALRQHAAAIREAELSSVGGRLGALSPRERQAVEDLTAAIVNKLLHLPTMALRQAGAAGDTEAIAAVREAFGLSEPAEPQQTRDEEATSEQPEDVGARGEQQSDEQAPDQSAGMPVKQEVERT